MLEDASRLEEACQTRLERWLRGRSGFAVASPYGTSITHPMNLETRAISHLERYSNLFKKYGIILRHDTQS